ncbi:MAG: hypothetical protein KIS96_14920 [Bauldia sp.]|nr:hypothetical protein [Bauldia sp.]
MTDAPKDDEKLRDSEIAIVDTLKMMMEILIATGTVKAEVFERLFAHQRDGYIAKEMANAAVIMEVLRGFAARPAAETDRDREALRKELDKPPQGSA